MNPLSRFLLAVSLAILAVPAVAQAAELSDAQIAAIVVTANQIDVDAGELAKSRSSDEEVRKFAERMITDHTAVNDQAVALVTRLGVEPEDSELSRTLAADAEKTRGRLGSLSGADFDKAYVDNEVAYHQAVLDVIDQQLLPNTENEELKALITKVRPAIEAHLEHARHLQASLE